jgi:uncharacterized repeat protein (TIGR02543 family)
LKVSWEKATLLVAVSMAAAALAGCPLPFNYNGGAPGSSRFSDPSSPKITLGVTVSYSQEGGASGVMADKDEVISDKTTTVTFSTETRNSFIYYTDDGSEITNLAAAKRIDGSSGQFTVSRGSSVQTLSICALAVGPNMMPSLPTHAKVTVSSYPVLSVSCDKASMNEGTGSATFTITSSAPAAAPITVNLLTGGGYGTGDAGGLGASGTAFTKTLAQGATTLTIPVTAQLDDDTLDETVTLTIQPDTQSTYTVAVQKTAQVIILDDKAPLYTVTYADTSHTGGSVPTDNKNYRTGETINVATQGSLTRTGYSFSGWIDSNGITRAAGSTMTMGSANVTLTAVWTLIPTYTVTYIGNGSDGGTAPTDGTNYYTGNTVTVSNAGSLANSTGFFAGWNTNASGTGTTYTPGQMFAMGSANVTLYAMWVIFSGTTITTIPQNVTNVVIPNGVTAIQGPPLAGPFQGHTQLVSVTIPSSMTTIPTETFMGCTQLTTFVSSSSRYQVINGALVDTNGGGTLLAVPAQLSGAFTIPPVTAIELYAFDYCSRITSITIPSTLTTISGNGFSGITSPIPIVLPSTVTRISAYAFTYSSFTSITIPASVTGIGISAMSGCTALNDVYMESATPPTLDASNVFNGSTLVTVHVPTAAAVTAYQADANWAATGVSIVTP